MRNLTILFFIAVLAVFPHDGYTQTKKGDIKISLGAYSGYGYPHNFSEGPGRSIPTSAVNGEYFIGKAFSAGPYIAYTYMFYKFVDPMSGYKDVWRGWDLGVKWNFYISSFFDEDREFDIYLSGFVGYTTRSLIYDRNNIYRDELNYSIDDMSAGGILGFRYNLNDVIGLYGEAGTSRKFFAGAGVTFNLNSKKSKSKK